MENFSFQPIGLISTPHKEPRGAPIQAAASRGAPGKIEIFPPYFQGLQDLGGFSHLILVYVFHLCQTYSLKVKPFLDDIERGVFATRAPARPNPIGLSVVRLDRVEGGTLHILDVDMLDGTPLLDIKPFVPQFDHREGARIGWLEGKIGGLTSCQGDDRFLR